MPDREMSGPERAALDNLNRVFSKLYGDVFGLPTDIPEGYDRVVTLPGGTNIYLKDGQHAYLYYEHEQWRFCYTPWKDENGHYWSWVYQPIGPGSQSGKAKKWKMTKVLRSSKRKTAQGRAERMWEQRRK